MSSPSARPKANIAKKPKQKSKARRVAGAFGRTLLTLFLIFVITCTLVGGVLAFYVINYITPQNIDLSSANLDSTTQIYANDPSTNQPVVVDKVSGAQNRIWITLDQMPKNLQNAFVCTEDQRFYEHDGVDWKRTVSSFANLFLHFYSSQQGGSTITQQLVNNMEDMGKNKNDYGRKIQEIVDALALEKKYDKGPILEAYLNTINMNEGCYGVETAAENYFGVHASQLDLAQCAALACLPKAPNTYDPRKNPEKNEERRKVVLKNMLDQKKITQQQYDQAVHEKVTAKPKPATSARGWFEDMVITDVKNDLVAKYGWDPDTALSNIYTKGLQIYTTMDPNVQSEMDKVYTETTNKNYWIQYPGATQPQSAMMVVNYQGQIKGVEGARGQKTGDMVYDRATDARALRPPGSSLKPLGVYAPAIDLNKLTWSTLISKSQIRVPNNPNPWPENDGDTDYSGSLSVVAALAQSVNTVAVHVDTDILTPQYTFDFLRNKLGFTTLDPKKDTGAGIAIGAVSGVTVEEMAGGYEIFGSNGLYTKPYSYTKVLDNQGNVLLQSKPIAKAVIGADTASVMNKLLQSDVTRPDGTGKYAKIPGVVVGGKTGTTNDEHDRWFCGITPDYVGVVWVGYDQPKKIAFYTSDHNPALQAWQAVMSVIDKNPVKKDFPYNSNVEQIPYNPATGYVTNGSSTAIGWYKATDIPTPPVNPAAS